MRGSSGSVQTRSWSWFDLYKVQPAAPLMSLTVLNVEFSKGSLVCVCLLRAVKHRPVKSTRFCSDPLTEGTVQNSPRCQNQLSLTESPWTPAVDETGPICVFTWDSGQSCVEMLIWQFVGCVAVRPSGGVRDIVTTRLLVSAASPTPLDVLLRRFCCLDLIWTPGGAAVHPGRPTWITLESLSPLSHPAFTLWSIYTAGGTHTHTHTGEASHIRVSALAAARISERPELTLKSNTVLTRQSKIRSVMVFHLIRRLEAANIIHASSKNIYKSILFSSFKKSVWFLYFCYLRVSVLFTSTIYFWTFYY